jgi:hypothetical protein
MPMPEGVLVAVVLLDVVGDLGRDDQAHGLAGTAASDGPLRRVKHVLAARSANKGQQ